MKLFATLLCALGLALLPLQPADAAHPPMRNHVQGRIASVDYSVGVVVVRAGRSLVRIEVTPSTQIYLHGHTAGFAEVHAGSAVVIRVSQLHGNLVAQIIRMP